MQFCIYNQFDRFILIYIYICISKSLNSVTEGDLLKLVRRSIGLGLLL